MPNRVDCSQLSLFPKDPRDLADTIGLDWWAAKKLYDDEWLSFDPETSLIDNFGMETEFVFLGSLVSAGCTPRILSKLLNRLEKPYRYDMREVFYDWPSQTWKDLPSQITREETAEEIICELEDIDDFYTKAPLSTALEEVMVFIKKHINLSFQFDGSLQRKERWQYPLEAIRELLLNAVVHRDYKNASDIVIKIFDERIIITSPGRLFGQLTIADLKRDDYSSSIRNKLLAEAFYLTGDIEKYGTGFIRIRQWLKTYPEIQYDIRESGDAFIAELFHQVTDDLKTDLIDLKTDLKRMKGLSETQAEIISAILENEFVTQQELSERIGITPRNIRNNMDTLKSKGLLKRIGPQRGGRWKLTLPQKGSSRWVS